MKIYLSPQVNSDVITYSFEKDIIEITINGITDIFDFTGVPGGILEMYDDETGEDLIQTNLPINPIISAEKKNGVLYLELLNWISEDATYEERFPEWIDAKYYVAPENDSGLDTGEPLMSDLPKEENLNESSPIENDELKDWSDF